MTSTWPDRRAASMMCACQGCGAVSKLDRAGWVPKAPYTPSRDKHIAIFQGGPRSGARAVQSNVPTALGNCRILDVRTSAGLDVPARALEEGLCVRSHYACRGRARPAATALMRADGGPNVRQALAPWAGGSDRRSASRLCRAQGSRISSSVFLSGGTRRRVLRACLRYRRV